MRRCVWSRNLVNEEALAPWGLSRQKKKLCTLAFWDFSHSYKKDQKLRWHVGLHTLVIMTPEDGTSVPKHVVVKACLKWCVTGCICWDDILHNFFFRFLKNHNMSLKFLLSAPSGHHLCARSDFIYHLTETLYNRCLNHPNPLISSIGNYSLSDLRYQYKKKYIHKRPKHILLQRPPPIAVFFPCSVFSLSTYKHLTRQTSSYHPLDET